MKHGRFVTRAGWARACALAIAAAPAAALAAAAQVQFVVGDVQVIAPNGQARTAHKGMEVDSGETVSTNAGRAQLRFTDGAQVSLQPQSDFRIDDYHYEGKTDGSERGFFSLLKGGLRTITGLVGRTNRRAYQVSTAVATIGIRGTEYTIAYTNSITGSVGEGEINVCNGAGCQPFVNGESFLVPDSSTLPQLTERKSDLSPPQPDSVPGGRFGDENDPEKHPGSTPLVAGDQQQGSTLLTGTLNLDGIYTFGFGNDNFFQNSAVALDANGVVTNLAGIVPAGPVAQTGNDGIIAWGSFPKVAAVAPEMLVFVTGMPVTNLLDLSTASKIGSYSLISPNGATPVLDPTSGTPIGTLNSASMTVNFGTSTATAQMGWSIQGSGYAANLNGNLSGAIFLAGSCTVGSCSVSALGQVFGPNAVRAGITYQFVSGSLNGIGAAGLTQTSLK